MQGVAVAGLVMRLRALGRALEPTAPKIKLFILSKAHPFPGADKNAPASLLGHAYELSTHTGHTLMFFMQSGEG